MRRRSGWGKRVRMAEPITYWPPGREALPPDRGPVRRRHVLYVPGYDPEAKRRSRSLFVRELVRYGRRFGLARRVVSAAEDLDEVPGLRWTVDAAGQDWSVLTTYDVLRWDDLVAADFARPFLSRLTSIAVGTVGAVWTGLAARLFRANWIFASVAVYPYAMVVLLVLVAGGAGLLGAWALAALAGLGWPLRAVAGAAVAVGIVLAARPLFERWFVWHLLLDWLFNWEHGNGWRADYLARVDRFANHLRAVAAAGEVDEILVIGHSSGAGMAIETAARALEVDPGFGRTGPEVAVLTVGTSLPAAALNSRAVAIHRNLARLMTNPHILWVEYQAPQDWLNAAYFNPVRMLPLGLAEADCVNPVIRSPRFAETTTQATYAVMKRNYFRMHFQFLMANDHPGEYDFFMIVLGPARLSWRIGHPEEAAALVSAPRSEAVEGPAG